MPRLATDPPVSERQRRAMFAAREGHSTLGIPKKVGEEFVGKDMARSDFRAMIRGLVHFFTEEEDEPEHAEDGLSLSEYQVLNQLAKGATTLAAGPLRDQLVRGGLIERDEQTGSCSITRSGRDEWQRFKAMFFAGDEGADLLKEEVGYSPGKGDDVCGKCEHYLGNGACSVVRGKIDPAWWCDRFDAKRASDAGIAAGILFVDQDGCFLLLKRGDGEENFAGHWALPGGKAEDGETALEAAVREAREELGDVEIEELAGPPVSIDEKTTPTGMRFHTFEQNVKRFEPKLNAEHSAFGWYHQGSLPEPMHPAVTDLLHARGETNVAEDAGKFVAVLTVKGTPNRIFYLSAKGTWGAEKESARRFDTREEARRAGMSVWRGHDATVSVAEDRHPIAFDKETVRETDVDGRLHVEITNISKANVCPYFGREIPDHEALGLDPNKTYRLLRHPDELKKAAATFNNLPLLSEHVPVTADDHRKDLVIGSTGTDAVFEKPYLKNSLVIWPRAAIDAVESEKQKELSCAYRYRADMTSGTYEGQAYDGVMRDIVGNHVALVEKGRAGPDVVVGDAAPSEPPLQKEIHVMAKSRAGAFLVGALTHFFRAADQKPVIVALDKALDGVTAKNWAEKKAGVKTALVEVKKLAKDADLEGANKYVDGLERIEEDEDPDPANPGLRKEGPEAGQYEDHLAGDGDEPLNFLKGKLSGDDFTQYSQMRKKAADAKKARDAAEPPDFAGKPKVGGGMVTKEAMDSAIAVAVRSANETQKGIRTALDAVQPYVGKLAQDHDSGASVYRTALKMLGVKGAEDVHESALPAILAAQPLPGAKKGSEPSQVAMDAADAARKSFAERFPSAARINAA